MVLYIRDTTSFSDRKDIIPDGLEMVCSELNLPYNKSLLISTWYRPPNSHMNIFDYWAGFLSKCDNEDKELILIGDLNCDVSKKRMVNGWLTDGFKILYLNARSLKAFVHSPENTYTKVCKISLFQDLVYSGNYDVVCVCETWLNNSVLSSEILPNYGTVYRRDRSGRVGGGVLVVVKSGIQATRRYDLEIDDTELIVIEVVTSNSKPVILYTFYRPPDSTPDVFQSLNNSLQRNKESSRIVMIGDFNLPSLQWSSHENVPVNTGGTSDIEAFCEMADDNFFQQFILGPTHIAGNKLDLLLCNSPEIIGDVCTSRPECYIVEIDIQLKFKRAMPVKRQMFDYKNGKFDGLRNFLARNPINITPTRDIDNYWEQWKATFLNAVKNFVPVRTVKDNNSPPWIDKEVRVLIRKKYTALKKYRMNRSAARKRKLRSLTHQTKRLIRTKHQEYLAKLKVLSLLIQNCSAATIKLSYTTEGPRITK